MACSGRILLLVFAVVVVSCLESVMGWSCSYIDSYGRVHTMYCPSSGCCGSITDRYCCDYAPLGSIVGGVVGFLFLVAVIVTIATCCCCACCPVYQYRNGSRDTVVIRTAPTTAAPAPANYGATRPYGYPVAKPPPYSQQ